MSEVHEMIKVLHIVACANVFILFHGRDWLGGVLKLMKSDHFLVFLVLGVLVPKQVKE